MDNIFFGVMFDSKDGFEEEWVDEIEGMKRRKWGCLFQWMDRWKWKDLKITFVKIYEWFDECNRYKIMF